VPRELLEESEGDVEARSAIETIKAFNRMMVPAS
jgi:hypothetical protein